VLLITFALTGGEAEAKGRYGDEVNDYCSANGRSPSMPYTGDCALCHDSGSSSRDRTVLFQAYRDDDFDAFCPPTANTAPTIDRIGDLDVSEDALVSIDIVARDADGDRLTLDATGLPTGAGFEDLGGGAGKFVWMPTFDQAGNHSITFTATDDGSPPESAAETITITVGNVNRPPVLASIGSQTIDAGEALALAVSASDPDGDTVEFGTGMLPDGASLSDFGDGTAMLSWTPTVAGNTAITVTVTDAGMPMESDAEEFQIVVGSVNQPPVLEMIGDRTAKAGDPWTVPLIAHDPNGGTLSFDCLGTPPGSTLDDPGNGMATLSGTAGNEAKQFDITCSVQDDAQPPASDAETFALTIGDVNRPPVLDPIGMTRDGETVIVRVTASDPDGDAITFDAVGVPADAEFYEVGAGAAELVWTPAAGMTGDFPIEFIAIDDGVPGQSVSAEFTITLKPQRTTTLVVRRAGWRDRRQVLRLAGRGAAPRAIVEVLDAATGRSLGELVANRDGRFRSAIQLDRSAAPCSVLVRTEEGESTAVQVHHAPADCGASEGVEPAIADSEGTELADRDAKRHRRKHDDYEKGDRDDDDDHEEEDEEDDD